jgi:uncharacterized protein (DUF2147 family)
MLGASLIVGGTARAAPDPRGVWIDEKGRGGVEIKDCGANLCGHIVWARDDADSSKGCGKQIIGDVEPQGSGLWDNGWIYDPDTDKRYDVELKPLDDNRLRVKGYAGVKFFSRSMVWTRAPADIKRCGATAAYATDPVRPGKLAATEPIVGVNAPTNNEASKGADHTPVVKSAEAADAPRPNENTAAPGQNSPQVATAEPHDAEGRAKGALPGKLRDLKFGSGYGVTATGGGNCRHKVPYFSIVFKCVD